MTEIQRQPPVPVGPESDSSGALRPSLAFLKTSIMTLLAGAVATVIAQRIVAPDQIERSLAPLLVLIIALVSWYLLSRDRIVAAKYVLVSGVWLVVATAALFTGGVLAPIGMTYPAIIISTAWLLSTRAAWVMTAFTIVCTLGTGVAQQWALLPTSWPSSTVMYVGDQIVIYVLSATLAAFLVRSHRSSHERLQLALSGGELGLWDWHIPSGEVLYSEHWFSMLGLPIGDGKLYLDSWTKLIHPDDLASVNSALESLLKGQVPTYECEHRVRHKDGRWLWLLDRGKVVEWDKSGAPVRAVGTYFDITQRKHAALELAISKSRYEGILQNTMEAYWRVDEKGRIVEANKAICEMLGYSKEELLRMSVTDIEVIESVEETRKHIEKVMREGRDIFESQHRCRNGRIIDVEVSASLAADAPSNIDVFHNDVTERKRMEREIRELAFHDPLTKLPNRRLLNDRLAQATTANKRSGFYGALIFLDLDNFKSLNDEHGHGAGDLLLVEVASRLRGCVREVDTVSRLGGDEFIVLLGDLTTDQAHATEQSNKLAEKIRVTLAQPYVIAGHNESEAIKHQCSASIGVVLFSKEHRDLENLLKWADAAMYRSKVEGRNRITFMVERRARQRH